MKGRDVILGILNNQERTGYEIKEIFQSQLSYFYDGTYGMIYPTLKKLEKEGLVSKKTIMQSGKPNKNIYTITTCGKKELQKYLESNLIEESYKSDFLMRLFFGDNLTNKELICLLKDEIMNKEKKILQLTNNLETWKNEGITKTQELTIKYGLAQYGATKAVLEEELKKLMNKNNHI